MATTLSTAPQQTPPAAAKKTAKPPARRGLHRGWHTLALVFGCAVGAALLAGLLSATPLLKSLEQKTYDLRFVLRGAEAPPPGVALVMMDDRTDLALPEPRIFWHPHYAALLRAIAQGGARAIGVDVFFAMSVEKWAPDLDRRIAEAFMEVSTTTPVVLGFDTLQPAQEGLPLYMLASAQGAMGFTHVTIDPDGFVRRQELQGKAADGGPGAESFAARLAAVTLQAERGVPHPVSSDPQRGIMRFGDRAVPLDRAGFMRIHYWGPGGTFPAISMADVLAAAEKKDAALLEKWFRGKTVLVGTLDPADMQPTPFYLAGNSELRGAAYGQATAGVEIHANALSTILEQRYLRDVLPGVTASLVLGASAVAAVLVFLLGFPLAPLALTLVMAVYVAITIRFQQAGIVLPVVAPAMAATLGGFAAYGAYSLTEGRQRKLLQEVFGKYVASDVARELLAYGEVPLGGTCQEITVMFSDLRNYTSYCQNRDPQLVVEELNQYFAGMTTEIKSNGGMVNKFIGDGIMALFGAPVPHPDDPLRAVRCGLGMVARNDEFNRLRLEQGLKPLVIGIGVHTGEAVVGNIGAPEKMEYTAIGDTVNIAARVESENKTFQSKLLISETTYQKVREHVVAEPAGNANMKGVSEAVMLYKILELKGGKT